MNSRNISRSNVFYQDTFIKDSTSLPLQDIYKQWLPVRRNRLIKELRNVGPFQHRKILFINATKGVQFYPSITDFFALFQRVNKNIKVYSVSYFDIYELQQGVADKDIKVIPLKVVDRWMADNINEYDLIIFVGPSEIMARIMSWKGVKSKLVFLDLAFYHQLIDHDPVAFYETKKSPWPQLKQRNKLVSYSCQSKTKIVMDIAYCFNPSLFEWRWFNYIPIGFDYMRYYKSSESYFDIALLATAARDYSKLVSKRIVGKKIVFFGDTDKAIGLDALAKIADIFFVPRVEQPVYAKLLALAKCVVMPIIKDPENVWLSLNDALASGKPVVICRHPGLKRILAQGASLLLYKRNSQKDIFDKIDLALKGGKEIDQLEPQSISFAVKYLDIYNILWTIVQEQIIG